MISVSFFFFNDPIWPDHRWWFRGNHMELSPSGFISGRWIIRTFPDDRMICTMWRVGLDYITHLLGVGQWIILISPDSSCFQGHYIYHSIPITLISLLYSYYIPTIFLLYPQCIHVISRFCISMSSLFSMTEFFRGQAARPLPNLNIAGIAGCSPIKWIFIV
jgi:hypothetical protein